MSSAEPLKTRIRSLPVLQGAQDDANFDIAAQTPHAAFEQWLDEAIDAGVTEPHAMTISTADNEGFPDARVLILKNLDARGWHFAIKSTSPKGQHIAGNPKVALTFYWPQVCRQIRIRGTAIKLSEADCREDFAKRPQGSKVSAMASKQSSVLSDPADLDRNLEEAEESLNRNPDLVMADWAVYAVAPTTVEFWQGATSRQHKRLQYVLDSDGQTWKKQALWP